MLTPMERLTRAASVGAELVVHCRLVWQEPTEDYPDAVRGYGVAVRMWSEARGMVEIACLLPEEDEHDDETWRNVTGALRLAMDAERGLLD